MDRIIDYLRRIEMWMQTDRRWTKTRLDLNPNMKINRLERNK